MRAVGLDPPCDEEITMKDDPRILARALHDRLESNAGILFHVTSRVGPDDDLRGRPPEVGFLHGSLAEHSGVNTVAGELYCAEAELQKSEYRL